MQNQLQKNKNFSTVYIIFAITEFFLLIFNLGKRLFYEDLSGLELLISLAKAIYFLLPLVAFIILSMQTILNINLAEAMHENLSGVTGEHAIGAVFVALILIAIKLILNLILLPALPLSIAGMIKCSSKKEIDQNRKNRRLGKKINIICLVIAVAELVFIW